MNNYWLSVHWASLSADTSLSVEPWPITLLTNTIWKRIIYLVRNYFMTLWAFVLQYVIPLFAFLVKLPSQINHQLTPKMIYCHAISSSPFWSWVYSLQIQINRCHIKRISATWSFHDSYHGSRFSTLYNLYQARVPSSHEEISRLQKNRAMYESAESGCDQRQDNLIFLKIRNNMSDRGWDKDLTRSFYTFTENYILHILIFVLRP